MISIVMFNRFKIKFFRSLAIFFCWLFLVSISKPLLAQNALPISESFTNATATNIVFGGSPGAILTANGGGDASGSGFLRLTTNGLNQTGFARSTGSFSSTNGVSVQFEYFTYGGNGADGIVFFLYDASVGSFNIGAFGGSLGYTQRNDPIAGVSKGFVAIGLDEFGNFSNPTEGRQGGPGFVPSSVTLRGSGDGNAQLATNYEYLTSIQTSNQTAMTNAFASTAFQIAGGVNGRGLTSANAGYRKVKMDLVPNGFGTGFNITVIITENTSGTLALHTVVNNFSYIPDDGIPATLSYGFAASTGGSNNFHEIRNIDILAAVAVAPTAVADATTTLEDSPVTFNIVNNDSDQNGNGTLNTGTGVDLNPSVAPIQTSRTVTGEGTYTYNGNGTVTFVPVANFNGTSTIQYTINDNGGLTSSSVNITVTVTPVNDEPSFTKGANQIVNKNAPAQTVNGWATVISKGPANESSQTLNFAVTNNNNPLFSVQPAIATDGTLTYTPAANVAGNATVTVILTDNGGTSNGGDDTFATQTFTITVNDAPVAVADAATTAEDTPVTFSVTGNDTDVDGTIDVTSVDLDPVTAGVQATFTVSGQGTYTASNTGTVTFTPVLNYNGTATPVNYVVKDNSGSLSNSTTITVTVTAVNDAPVAVADAATTAEDTPVTFSVTGNDTDVDGTIDVTIVDLDPVTAGVQTTFTVSGQGTYTASNTGTVTFTPVLNYNGTATPVNYV
ncbi:Ig-like domain-containing protein, partial [Daejeonella sp.]|uniref:Ig-like domain-containing protein n=1 Tax=Daejeonella sp. TaxID=2805397 RepID=UPI002730BE62